MSVGECTSVGWLCESESHERTICTMMTGCSARMPSSFSIALQLSAGAVLPHRPYSLPSRYARQLFFAVRKPRRCGEGVEPGFHLGRASNPGFTLAIGAFRQALSSAGEMVKQSQRAIFRSLAVCGNVCNGESEPFEQHQIFSV